MLKTNESEIDLVLSFFRRHQGRELDVCISLFEGLNLREKLRVEAVGGSDLPSTRVLLRSNESHRELELDLVHYSFATVSPDGKAVEISRLLADLSGFRLIASEPQ